MNTKASKKCEFILRRFMSVDESSPELTARFREWLLDGRLCREKKAVVRKLFDEMVPDEPEWPDEEFHFEKADAI